MKLRKTSTGWRDLHTIPLEGLTTMPASAQEWKVAKCQLGRKGSQVAGRSDDGKEDFFHGKHRGWSWVLVLGLLPSSLGQRHGGQLIRDLPLGKKKKKRQLPQTKSTPLLLSSRASLTLGNFQKLDPRSLPPLPPFSLSSSACKILSKTFTIWMQACTWKQKDTKECVWVTKLSSSVISFSH